jgi:peptidyl-prolyl cis-trans isomerase B (cyclophilin B)
VSKADKRERQRQNREAARIERERLMKRDRRLRALRGLLFVLVPVVILVIVFSLLAGGDDNGDGDETASGKKNGCTNVPTDYSPPTKDADQDEPAMTIDPTKTYTAAIKTSCGTITVGLDAAKAPVATNNFVSLARSGFYDGLCIDRAAQGFVIQGGTPKCDQAGDAGYTVKGEVPTDNYPTGSIAGAKGGTDPAGSMGSAFFIVTGAGGASLPNDYARIGSVTEGLEVAQKIESFSPSAGDGPPTQRVLIDKVTITES